MEAQNSKIQSACLQQDFFCEAAHQSAADEKANRISRRKKRLAHSEAERRRLLAQIIELKTQQAQRQTALAKTQQTVEEKLALMNDALERYERLFAAMDEQRQKDFRWSFKA